MNKMTDEQITHEANRWQSEKTKQRAYVCFLIEQTDETYSVEYEYQGDDELLAKGIAAVLLKELGQKRRFQDIGARAWEIAEQALSKAVDELKKLKKK